MRGVSIVSEMKKYNELNKLLKSTYNTVNDLQEKKVKKNKHLNLTISELHLMEAISEYLEQGGATITDLANDMNYTLSAATIAVNGLVKKGYICKEQDPQDKRSVRILLTERGEKINQVHIYIHKRLMRDLSKELDDKELEILMKSLTKIKGFFENLKK